MKSLLSTLALTALAIAHIAAGGGQLLASGVSNLLALIEPHHTVTVSVSPAAWHAAGTSTTAEEPQAPVQPTRSNTIPNQSLATAASAPSQPAPIAASVLTSASSKYVTHGELTAAIAQAIGNLPALPAQAGQAGLLQSTALTPDVQAQLNALQREIALSNNINNLAPSANAPLTISSPTVSNPVFTGTVAGLTAAEIPTDIVAANYLPLSGGTLTGDLTGTDLILSGNLTVSGAQTLSGAITVPYITATSTTLASSFQQLLVNGSTTLQNFTFLNATGTAATTTSLFSTLGHFTTGIFNSLTASITNITGLTAANSTTTNATSTSLFAGAATISSLTGTAAIFTNATSTNLFATNASTTNATSTNLYASSLAAGNATSTNLFATLGHFTTGIIDTLTSTAATITNLIATTITGTNATFTNATSTNATSTNAFTTNFTATNATSTNLFASVGTFTSGIFNSLTASIANITGLTAVNSTTTNATSTNAFATNFTATNATTTGNAYFANSVLIGAQALSGAKFAVALASAAVTDSFVDQGRIAVQNGTVESSGSISLIQAACGSYSVIAPDGNTYATVLAEDGNCWFATNLGTTHVPTSYSDSAGYGALYQWGRLVDGHQLTNSATTGTLSSTDNPGTSSFILAPSIPNDWRSPQNNNLWGAGSRTNNVCPAGWHVPTQVEWATWSNDAGLTSGAGAGSNGSTMCGSSCFQAAYNTNLKLSAGGLRGDSSGALGNQGSYGSYWSSSINGTLAYDLYFIGSTVDPADNSSRAYGFSVRCIQGS